VPKNIANWLGSVYYCSNLLKGAPSVSIFLGTVYSEGAGQKSLVAPRLTQKSAQD